MIHIACASDDLYIPHCAAMMHSVLQKSPGVSFYFMYDGGEPPHLLPMLGNFVRESGGKFVAVPVENTAISQLPDAGRIPRNMWYRILLPDLLADLDRVLYLDCDTIVLEDLSHIWDMDLTGYTVAAVDNVIEEKNRSYVHSLGVAGYFNSGVLLLNLSEMRKTGASEKLLQYGLANGSGLLWPDQDALNVCLGSTRLRLHPRWNCQSSLFYLREAETHFSVEDLDEAKENPAILHFEGGSLVKPWHYLSKHPMRGAYRFHRGQTPWPLDKQLGETFANKIIGLFPERFGWKIYGLKRLAGGLMRTISGIWRQ